MSLNSNAQKVWKTAEAWVGRYFNQGEPAQCAAFVRWVYAQAGVFVGVAGDPSGPPENTGPALADSFSTDTVGALIPHLADALPGDIIMYANTYGGWAPGTITHVGIVSQAGGGNQIDRSTSDAPVHERSPHTFATIAEIRRPYSLIDGGSGGGAAVEKLLKLFVHKKGAETVAGLTVDGESVSLKGVQVNGKKVEAADLEEAGIHEVIVKYAEYK